MALAAVLWFGEGMSAVPLRKGKATASAVRAVTVLGATGSIGDSTMDLLRASPGRYQVEALTAHSNVPALAKLALCCDRRSGSARRIERRAGRHRHRMRRR
jgi:1-deoxy-D-xylulose-5-phosphate reductoisomerase